MSYSEIHDYLKSRAMIEIDILIILNYMSNFLSCQSKICAKLCIKSGYISLDERTVLWEQNYISSVTVTSKMM